MDTKMYGIFERSIDSKGRIILPNKLVKPNTEIVFLKDSELEFKIYLLKQLEQIIEKYKNIYHQTFEVEKRKQIDETIESIILNIVDTYELDEQNRAVIPKLLRKEYELSDNVILNGLYDHFKVFPSEIKYKEYIKRSTIKF